MTFRNRFLNGPTIRTLALAALATLMTVIGAARIVAEPPEGAASPRQAGPPADAASSAEPAREKPHDSLAAGYKQAQRTRRPLFVRVGGASCRWCRMLEADLQTSAGIAAVDGFTLVAIDADTSVDDARAMGASAIPALRIVSPEGRILASHDGYLPPDELAAWLGSQGDAAVVKVDEELAEAAGEQPTALGIVKIVRYFGDRDARIREAAIRRLRAHPDVARALVVKTLCEGNLNSQLTALELIAMWKGPVKHLDPWRPETMTDERKAELRRWAEQPLPDGTLSEDGAEPEPLDEVQLAEARQALARLLSAKPTEVEPICERLSRLGKPLLEEIALQTKAAQSDEARHRLLLLRYRILASDGLTLRWPGGLPRLAAVATEERRAALEELSELAGPDDLPLLSELFRESDPLIRELALRALRQAGGRKATNTLVSLLDDPEPNVRAAVLKMLSESPESTTGYRSGSEVVLELELVDKIAKYALKEQDADLVVHAIRVLKGVPSARSTMTLVELFKHPSWQARAEAAEAVGKRLDGYGDPTNEEVKSRLALADLLDDSDSFVVSKALESLPGDSTAVLDKMVAVTVKHPSLTLHVIQKMDASEGAAEKVLGHLRTFAMHSDAGTRAAAIARLVTTVGEELDEKEITRWLSDEDAKVRAATAQAIETALSQQRPTATDPRGDQFAESPDERFGDAPARQPGRGLVGSVLDFFFKPNSNEKPNPQAEAREPAPAKEDADAKPDAADSKAAAKDDKAPPANANAAPSADALDTGDNAPEGPREATPDAAVDSLEGKTSRPDRLDVWLAENAAGKHHPAWAAAAIPLLEKMLTAADREERGAAALALVALGRVEQGLPPLLKEAAASPAEFARAAATLSWLPWARRAAVFDELLKSTTVAPEAYHVLVRQMAEAKDPRAVDVLWAQLADEETAPSRAEIIGSAVAQCLFGERHYISSKSDAGDQQALETLSPRIATGPPWQRIAALALLVERSAGDAAEQAEKLVADETLPERVRCLAFQVQLMAVGESERRELSIAALAETDACRRRLALTCLAEGTDSLRYLGELGYVYSSQLSETHYSSSDDLKIILPAAPNGLKKEHLTPVLADSDPAVKARAGYLLALLGDAQGLEPLLAYWKSDGAESRSVTRLVYRAIAALDDEAQLAVLKQIYETVKDGYEVSDFYWTIRGMTDRSVLEFRGQIRKEVGMDRLN